MQQFLRQCGVWDCHLFAGGLAAGTHELVGGQLAAHGGVGVITKSELYCNLLYAILTGINLARGGRWVRRTSNVV